MVWWAGGWEAVNLLLLSQSSLVHRGGSPQEKPQESLKDTNVSDFEVVGKVSDFEVGRGRAVPYDGRMVAVFRQESGEWYAIDDLCPHMGASLAEGYVEGNSVTCPWHAWRFCVADGTWEDNPRVKVDSFEVQVDGDDLKVRERAAEKEAE